MTVGRALLSIELSARLWAGIDARMDNVAAVATQTGDVDTARTARDIRRSGWAQVPWADGQWPPMDQILCINLDRRHWNFALDGVRKGFDLNRELGLETSWRLCEEIIATIEPLL